MIFADIYPGCHFGGFFSSFMVYWPVCSYIQIKLFTVSVMPKLVYLMTVQEAHKEYNSLMDKIRAKYEQLDLGKFGSPGTPAFDAEACELAHLLARVSELCIKLNLPTPKELYRLTVFKHWRHFSDQNSGRQFVRVWRMQLCSHRYVRITGLLSTL